MEALHGAKIRNKTRIDIMPKKTKQEWSIDKIRGTPFKWYKSGYRLYSCKKMNYWDFYILDEQAKEKR